METGYNTIVVTLDGALVRTSLFLEAVTRLIKRNPLNLFSLLWWLLGGIAFLKDKVARSGALRPDYLPYEEELLTYLKECRSRGYRLILVSRSNWLYAEQIADYLGLFDTVLAGRNTSALTGERLLDAIRTALADSPFAFAGGQTSERTVWNRAAGHILVNPPRALKALSAKAGKTERVISSRKNMILAFLQEMRLHQHAKNLLVFVPLFTSHTYVNPGAIAATLMAFVCFGLCASGVYFLNDLLDLEADRRHARKRTRPLAAGDLPLSVGFAGALSLPVIAFSLAIALLPGAFVVVLAVYFVLTNLYSFILKRVQTADVVALGVLYTLRVVAGAAVIGIILSSWLLAFSIFVFISLAYLKRYIEVAALAREDSRAPGRGYIAADSETMFTLGAANMTAAVVVLALYINREQNTGDYGNPNLLWLLCLLMLYWGNRLWVGARRGDIEDDPVVFALKDNVSRVIGIAFAIVVLAAKYTGQGPAAVLFGPAP